MVGRSVLWLALAALLATGCVSDGAVRLARCLESGAKRLAAAATDELSERCELRVPRGSKVVAFPPSAVSTAQLRQAGLSTADVGIVNELQLLEGPYARLNVLPPARRPRPSRTTYHRRFVDTPELLVCTTEDSGVRFSLRRANGSIALTALE